jgi:hypothetical protein
LFSTVFLSPISVPLSFILSSCFFLPLFFLLLFIPFLFFSLFLHSFLL